MEIKRNKAGSEGRNVICVSRSSEELRKNLVDREGIEPPTQGFSVLCSTN